ncbi:hypothetical protein [Flagellimonas sp. CMM7]|uniref:hypothetical protein n=1 Tax=Flagellimonas sp. CMM7 TaxID=2654676 RepID=UPI0013D2D373|nr:hypothetical protein [Flagellimonas sp. CMM7]UII79868.1 hypothetical protein LV704_19690 [Flagellimonas sp. CMM7]
MEKNNKKMIWMALVISFLFGFSSCENPLEVEFPDVLIVNQPPRVSEIGDKLLKEISLPKEFDLAVNVNDQENDILTFTATSRDVNVVEAGISGSTLVLQSVGIGTTVVDVVVVDSAGNEVATAVNVEVEPGVDIDFVLDINFDVPDGEFATQTTGVFDNVEFIFSGDPSNVSIISGAAVVGPVLGEWAGFEIFTVPLNVAEIVAQFEFKYANVSDPALVNIFFVAGEEFSITLADLGQEIILNDPNFNSVQVEDLQVLLEDLGIEADLENFAGIGFNSEEAGVSFSIDDLKLGIKG